MIKSTSKIQAKVIFAWMVEKRGDELKKD